MTTQPAASGSPLRKAALVVIAQVLLVSATGAKLLYDRATLPRGWVATIGIDPDLPIRGRYVRLNAVIDGVPPPMTGPGGAGAEEFPEVGLAVNPDTGMVQAVPAEGRRTAALRTVQAATGETVWTLSEPVVFFLPEGAEDPSRLEADDALWVEATVTRGNSLRPIRLGLYRQGVLTPLPLD